MEVVLITLGVALGAVVIIAVALWKLKKILKELNPYQ